ncbi:MAG: hypothetical protein ACFFG0_54665 [Candidatus Thorarchaeota archaeon]
MPVNINTALKIGIGLVGRWGNQFVDKWIESANRSGDVFLVVDNGIDKEAREKIINHPKTKHYHIQNYPSRNMSRDYQKVLDYAKEEKCDWVWIMDFDKYVPDFNIYGLKGFLLDSNEESISFPLFKCRGDNKHYVMINDKDGQLKHARLAHEMYRVKSHFCYDIRDEHSGVIPQNCKAEDRLIWIPIHHFGHMTKELREEKRQKYIKDKEEFGYDDKGELSAPWMEEDETKIVVKEFSEIGGIKEDGN